MTALASTAVSLRPRLAVSVAGVLGGVLVGALLAWQPIAGVAAVFALLYAAVASVNLPLAMGLWVPMLFLEGLPGALMLPEAGAAVVVGAWLAEAARPGSWQREQLRRRGRLLLVVALFVVWLALTLAWAEEPDRSISLLASTVEVAAFFVVVATALSRPEHLRIVAAGFVAGALLSATIGIMGELAGVSAVQQEGRLQGSSGDPNYFAAQLIAAMVLAIGLAATTRHAGARFMLVATLVPLAYGVLASESRGGVVTFIAIAIAGFFVFRRQRVQVLAVTVAVAAVLGLWFSADTAAWERLVSAREDRGSGRTDLWTIALRMSEDHPLTGVGLNNFPVHSPEYTRLPGALTGVMHVEREQEAHNAYLSLLAETGVVGLVLFLAIAGSVVAGTARSIRRFESLHDRRSALLGRVLLVAMVGMLSAAFFLPNAADKRIWVLMGLGVVSLALAERAGRAPPAAVR